VKALLLDNGFLVPRALQQAKRVCRQLDVPLVVVTPKARAKRAFDRAVAHADAGDRHPCEDCSALVADALLAFAEEVGAGVVYAGSNYFVAWDKNGVRATTTVNDVLFAHLPYAFRLKRAAVLRHVRALGATVPNAPGISSNCRVPALVNARGVVDHVPEREDLSLEVMVGHRSRRSALDELRRKTASGRHSVRRFYSTPRSG
jgi:PP-loop superfamily ATP-utilizing enzyme